MDLPSSPRGSDVGFPHSAMQEENRHRRILEVLEKQGTATVAELSGLLRTTDPSIARDLAFLEGRGRLQRVRGGAVRIDRAMELAFGQRSRRSLTEKRRIAKRAVEEFVTEGATLIIEGSTTCAELLPFLRTSWLTLHSNNLPVLSRVYAAHRHITVHSCGGMVSQISGNCVGREAVAYFGRIQADVFFMSATGMELPTGRLTDPNPIETEVTRAMAAAAEKVVLLLDATKLNSASVADIMPVREVHCIITDSRATARQRSQLRKLGPRLIVV